MTGVIVKKTFLQIKRDKIMLLLTLICAPFFIFLYKLIFLEGMTIYNVGLYSSNKGITKIIDEFIDSLEEYSYPGGGKLFILTNIDDYNKGIELLENHKLKIIIDFKNIKEIEIIGDFSDPYFVLSSNMVEKFLREYILEKLDMSQGINITQKALGISRNKSEFENYVPGLYIFSTLLQLFLFTLLLVKEKESKLYIRYTFCSLKKSSYILGHLVVFSVLTITNLLLTTATAYLLGFQSPNSVLYDIFFSVLVCFILNLSVIGVSFIVLAFSKNSIHSLLLTTFPFMIMVFFSGSVYPFPGLEIFKLIPATHAVNILHKLLTYGTTPLNMLKDFILLISESILLFILGLKLFRFKIM